MASKPRATVQLAASVPPIAALWLWRREGERLLVDAAAYERRGDVRAGRELRATYEQLRSAAAQVTTKDLFPRTGSAEVGGSEAEAESEVSSSWDGVGVAEAAGMLNVSRRQVRYWLADGQLSGSQRTPRSSWQIDRHSVVDLRDSRSRR